MSLCTCQVMLALKDISSTIDTMKSPLGEDKKSPSRSCHDLFLTASQAGVAVKSGKRLLHMIFLNF